MNTAIINTLLAADTAEKLSLGERLLTGLPVLVIGMVAVFLVLSILMGVLSLFKTIFYDIPEKKKAEAKNSPEIAQVTIDPPASAADESEDDTQLIAVITAAIAAYRASAEATSNSGLPFRVVSYKRARGANGWNGAENNETV